MRSCFFLLALEDQPHLPRVPDLDPVNGDRRSFTLLRPSAGDASSQERLREAILEAYGEYEETTAVPT